MTLNLSDRGAHGVYPKQWSILEALLWIATGDLQAVQGLGAIAASVEWISWPREVRMGAAAVAASEHIRDYACRCGQSGRNARAVRAWDRLTAEAQSDPDNSWLREEASERWCICVSEVAQRLLSALREKRIVRVEGAKVDWHAVSVPDVVSGRPDLTTLPASEVRRIWPRGWSGKATVSDLALETLEAFLMEHQPKTRNAYNMVRAAFPDHYASKDCVETACRRLFPERRRGRPRNVPAHAETTRRDI